MDLNATPQTKLWTLHRAVSPILGTAIHDGHLLDPSVASCMALNEQSRLREEDPFTGRMIAGMPNSISCNISRFCIDLNRGIEAAVYRKPSDAWGLTVWNRALGAAQVDHLKLLHRDYYTVLEAILKGLESRHGTFVVLDVHSYNHRRDGPDRAPTSQQDAPDINIGTFSMGRDRWGHVVDAFIAFCRSHTIQGRRLDVRENVAFEGRGEQTRFIHERFPASGCAIAVEFKKFFMDEWTGAPDDDCIGQLSSLLTASVPVLERALAAKS